jgi:pyridinium-3,5-biscarboxylic acid mononucleotide sulfurtransferase
VSLGLASEHRGLVELRRVIGHIPDPVVAFSGGVDSSLVAVVAHEIHGDGARAVIADSPSLPRDELAAATSFAERHDLPLRVIPTRELHDPRYRSNGSDRCGFCKEALLEAVISDPLLASGTILLGVNLDDLDDHRPGQRLARERGARFPLVEARLGKQEVRALARQLRLETWDKPAAACLASRLAYGVPVSEEALRRIEHAEAALRTLGFGGDVRVRDQGAGLARVEVPTDRFEDVITRRAAIVQAMHDAGFRYVTLDLEGFRSGSHNLTISRDAVRGAAPDAGTGVR